MWQRTWLFCVVNYNIDGLCLRKARPENHRILSIGHHRRVHWFSCEMLRAQLPVFGLFQLSIWVLFMLLSYGPILSCSCAIGGFFIPTAENCGRDDFLESTYSAAKFYQRPPEPKHREQECTRTDSEHTRETEPDR